MQRRRGPSLPVSLRWLHSVHNRSEKMKMQGVEDFLAVNKIYGEPADIIRAWARESMYWNALFLLDPVDIAVQLTGAPDAATLEAGLERHIERKLGISY